MCDYSQEVCCSCKGVGGSVAKERVLVFLTSPRLTSSLLEQQVMQSEEKGHT